MKKCFLLVLLFALQMPLCAQQHLDFRGVPICGHIDNFVAKMKELGYTYVEKDGKLALMKGQFANRDVDLVIVSSPKTKQVWKVAVFFPEQVSWSSLKSLYFEYKDLYKIKYGSPKNEFEFFSSPYYEGDGYELQALRNEKCTYFTYFERSNGLIAIQLTGSVRLSISYEDSANAELKESERTSSALNDI